MERVPHALLDLLLPRSCPGCRFRLPLPPGRRLSWRRAASAWRRADAARRFVCDACAAVLAAPPARAVPAPCPPGLPRTWAVAPYDGPARGVVVAHKERARLALSATLAVPLARAAAEARPEVLVWVPSSPAAIRARGYDHARRLAVRAARLLGVPAVRGLAVARRVADQSHLDARQRAANLTGAFRAEPAALAALAGRRVVLVDDVMTTGWSLTEAARALRAAGVEVVGAAVVAASARRPAPQAPGPGPATARSAGTRPARQPEAAGPAARRAAGRGVADLRAGASDGASATARPARPADARARPPPAPSGSADILSRNVPGCGPACPDGDRRHQTAARAGGPG